MYRFAIGRDDDCHVVLRAPSVSRHHAHVSLGRNGKIHFEDAGSTNGSYLLEGDTLVRITTIDLAPEAQLQLGKLRISVAEILRVLLDGVLQAAGRREMLAGREAAQLRRAHGPGAG